MAENDDFKNEDMGIDEGIPTDFDEDDEGLTEDQEVEETVLLLELVLFELLVLLVLLLLLTPLVDSSLSFISSALELELFTQDS